MRLLQGPNRIALALLNTRRYYPEQVLQTMLNQRKPYFLDVDGVHISVDPDRELWVACQAVCAEHNAGPAREAPEEDGFEQEVAEIEARVQAHMDDSAASEASTDEAPSPSEDMVYEREVYM